MATDLLGSRWRCTCTCHADGDEDCYGCCRGSCTDERNIWKEAKEARDE